MNRKEVCRKYVEWCDDCPKAYDFSCSGADMKKCTADKDKFLNDWLYNAENKIFCVVVNSGNIRAIFETPYACGLKFTEEDVRESYYESTNSVPMKGDEFYCFRGVRKAQMWADRYSNKHRVKE